MTNRKIPCLCKFCICIDLLFGCKIWLRDDCFRINYEICRIWKIRWYMSDMDIETLSSEGIKKGRISPIRTRNCISKMLVISRKSRNTDSTDTDNMKVFLSIFHTYEYKEKYESRKAIYLT